MKNIFVADVMTRNPITAKPSENLMDCAKKMIKSNVSSLILVDKNILKGILTQHDILWAIIKKSKDELPLIKAIDISPRKLATIRPTATISEAMRKMKRLKFERLPVIQEGELLGVITAKDILNFNPEFYPELEEISKIREESQKLNRLKRAKIRTMTHGICEECGNVEMLYRFNGMLICNSCMND